MILTVLFDGIERLESRCTARVVPQHLQVLGVRGEKWRRYSAGRKRIGVNGGTGVLEIAATMDIVGVRSRTRLNFEKEAKFSFSEAYSVALGILYFPTANEAGISLVRDHAMSPIKRNFDQLRNYEILNSTASACCLKSLSFLPP